MSSVEEMVDELPWFACGQLLLLKAMKQLHHPFFDTRLTFASLYATNRHRLERYLRDAAPAGSAAKEEAPLAVPADSDGFELVAEEDATPQVVPQKTAQVKRKMYINEYLLREQRAASLARASRVEQAAPAPENRDEAPQNDSGEFYLSLEEIDGAK